MARYIDADRLYDVLWDLVRENMEYGLRQEASGIVTAICQLTIAPTADVQEVEQDNRITQVKKEEKKK